jgi:hypothetical protein
LGASVDAAPISPPTVRITITFTSPAAGAPGFAILTD